MTLPSQLTTETKRLRAQLRGRSDAEIVRGIEATSGIETALEEVFTGMVRAFDPARAKGQTALLQYDVVVPRGLVVYQLDVRDGACIARPGAQRPARVTLRISFPDLLRLVSGELGAARAFFTGRLKVGGDILLAQAMQSWFEVPG